VVPFPAAGPFPLALGTAADEALLVLVPANEPDAGGAAETDATLHMGTREARQAAEQHHGNCHRLAATRPRVHARGRQCGNLTKVCMHKWPWARATRLQNQPQNPGCCLQDEPVAEKTKVCDHEATDASTRLRKLMIHFTMTCIEKEDSF